VPADPRAQLREAVAAVFRSSGSRRARTYRKHYGLPQDMGTAVTVQAMVFGNLDARSGTGVLFSRNPLDGPAEPYGEYLPEGQGEDVVSGERTPQPLSALRDLLPDVHDELLASARALEAAEGDVQDIEFTVQSGTLYLLQARAAKRSALAAVRIAVDLVAEGLIDEDEALARVTAEQVRTVLRPALADGATDGRAPLAEGIAASQGVALGVAVVDPDEAVARRAAGEDVVLVRATTSPDDIHGMVAAGAIVTGRGGSTSHAAVVGRALGKPCVVGAGDGVLADLAGQVVTVDGDGGRVFAGELPLRAVDEAGDPGLRRLAAWAGARTAVRVVAVDEAGAEVVDLDRVAGGHEAEGLAALIAPGAAVRGAVLATDAGVAAAVAAGAGTLVAPSRTATLLAALAAAPG
jgi:pyruvate, orthophosphate dikinase